MDVLFRNKVYYVSYTMLCYLFCITSYFFMSSIYNLSFLYVVFYFLNFMQGRNFNDFLGVSENALRKCFVCGFFFVVI